MGYRFSMPAFALIAGLLFSPSTAFAETETTQYKVLAGSDKGFNVSALEKFIDEGDAFVQKGNLTEARKSYDKARNASKQLLSFYRDLGGAFRGLDARIPREMDQKGRRTLQTLSKVNLRLAALFRRQNQPEVAVPVLVEVVRLMTPTHKDGQKAYQTLVELGFVETPYLGGS